MSVDDLYEALKQRWAVTDRQGRYLVPLCYFAVGLLIVTASLDLVFSILERI